MARTTINRSISFDPEVFDRMENRRGSLDMDRSEYIKRCILRDMAAGGAMVIPEGQPTRVVASRLGRKKK